MTRVKSLKVSDERLRRLKLLAANANLPITEVFERFGGPGIDAEYERQFGADGPRSAESPPASRKPGAKS